MLSNVSYDQIIVNSFRDVLRLMTAMVLRPNAILLFDWPGKMARVFQCLNWLRKRAGYRPRVLLCRMRGWIPWEGWNDKEVKRFRITLERMDGFICVDEGMKHLCNYSYPRVPAVTIPLPLLKQCKLLNQGLDIVTVTSFKFKRKVEPLLSIAPTVKQAVDQGLADRWYIAGDGPLLPWFERELRNRIGSCDKVVLTGWVRDVESFLQRGHLFVYATAADFYSNALVEASIAGLPIVLMAPKYLLPHFVDSLNCLRTDTIEGFATRMQRFYSMDLNSIQALQVKAQQGIKQFCNVDVLSSKFERFLVDVCNRL